MFIQSRLGYNKHKSKKYFFRYILCLGYSYCFLLFIPSGLAYGIPTFGSDRIALVYSLLPIEIKEKYVETKHCADETIAIHADLAGNDAVLNFRLNGYNELIHIGIRIIKPIISNYNHLLVTDFIERNVLHYFLIQSNSKIFELMKADRVQVRANGKTIPDDIGLPILSYMSMDTATNFKLFREGQNILAIWSFDLLNHFELIFPVDIFTISGMRKDELEKSLIRSLENLEEANPKSLSIAKEDELVKLSDSLFILVRESYEDIPDINNNLYYHKANDNFPVFSHEFLHESLSNLLLNVIPSKIQVNLSVIAYEEEKQIPSIGINDFLSFFQNNYSLFFGWQNKDYNNLLASVFIYNEFYDYLHLLVISVPEDLMDLDNLELTGQLFPFIPKHNLKN